MSVLIRNMSIRPDHHEPLDVLSRVLQDLHLEEVRSGRGELHHPWGIDFAPEPALRFHLVAAGRCSLRARGHAWVALEAGDVVLLPHGNGHVLCSDRRVRPTPLGDMKKAYVGDRSFRMRASGRGDTTLLFCCDVALRAPGIQPLLELLPSQLVLRAATTDDPVLLALLETMTREVREERIGCATILSRLAEVVVTRVVRAWAEEHDDETTGWLAAIHDPKIGRALAAIHRDPGTKWSIGTLARQARASRSDFAQRFAHLVGVTPARYLTRLRMHIAGRWLRAEQLSVAEAASRAGYESEASFSRAFKRHVGISPGRARRDGG
jgi:AraC-like DNA-binding protein